MNFLQRIILVMRQAKPHLKMPKADIIYEFEITKQNQLRSSLAIINSVYNFFR